MELVADVSSHPEKYQDRLLCWKRFLNDGHVFWQVFEEQHRRWQDFRIWQINHQGLFDEEAEFASRVEFLRELCLQQENKSTVESVDDEEGWIRE